jgi:two-component sensor histidine kinase
MRKRGDARRHNLSHVLDRSIFVGLVLIPWLALGTYFLTALYQRERDTLQSAALARASAAAAFLDQQVSDSVQRVDWLQSRGADRAAGKDVIADPHGVQFKARNSTLDAIAPASSGSSISDEMGAASRSAAEEAISTKMPRITPDDTRYGGIDLWLPLFKEGYDPVLLQARIPATFLNESTKAFTQGPWTMAIVDANGAAIAKLDGIDEQNHGLKAVAAGSADRITSADSYVEATSKASPLGFQMRAATSLAPLEAENRRNWVAFLFVTGLLAAATLAAERWMFRVRAIEDNQQGSQPLLSLGGAREVQRDEQRAGSTQMESTVNHSPQRPEPLADMRLHEALDAGGICAWEWRAPSSAVVWKTSCAQLLRLPPNEPLPTLRALLRRTFPHERRRLLHAIRVALAESRPLSIDVRLTCFDGEQRWVAIRSKPLYGEAGRINGFTGIAYDVTDQKRGLSRTDALLREVSHRSKNMLALILAMARLTARDAADVKSYLKEFALRVAGLAASQDLIVAADWQSVDFTTLAAAEVEAVARSDAPRIRISGPTLLVTPEAAQTLGMILTELALNAIEHGALSVATGEVHLSWSYPNASTVRISWRETGGPQYDDARPRGYGLSVIERFSTQGLKLESRLENDADHVTWTLEGPLAHIGIRSPPLPA